MMLTEQRSQSERDPHIAGDHFNEMHFEIVIFQKNNLIHEL